MRNDKMSDKSSSHKKQQHQHQTPPSHRKSRWEANNPQQPPDSKPSSSSSHPTVHSSPLPPPAAAGPSSDPPVPISLPPPGPTAPFPLPDPGPPPPPPPSYGFHMLERRTIVLADGSVRSYFALPPDDIVFSQSAPLRPPRPLSPDALRRDRDDFYARGGGPPTDYWNSLGLEGRGPPPHPETSQKRKYGDEGPRDARDEYARQRQQLLQYGGPNPNGYPSGLADQVGYVAGASSPRRRDPLDPVRGGMDDLRPLKHMKVRGDDYDDLAFRVGNNDGAGDANTKHLDVDPNALKRAFLRFSKMLNEYASHRNNYLENGKNGPLRCLACDRDSKDYADVHGLIMHAYNSQNAALRVDHLGLHKALCVLMGWNYAKGPDSSKAYESFSASEAEANKEDLIIWPPIVIIHNTKTGRKKDGRVEGLGNKEMDNKLKELGFSGGKSKSMYGRDGHMGITVVKFTSSQSGLKEAERLAEFFEKDKHGRRGWAHAQASQLGEDDEQNPNLVKVDEKTGEKKRIFYGYLGTSSDLDKVDFDMKKKAVIKSRREFDLSD
ncbi:protein SUPPRESSOR OF GENE SILENCING 3 [Magnolia sinica]|uniref:protein SUPPRESSOR OF GENE SILENCING 3 n=1 Tax=Magnolia sinica TaxID=86752 RepID=UPI00265917EA|nr:protein SUPPRESSOR OF GENE SILENCING 3 [Magnolia sinica]